MAVKYEYKSIIRRFNVGDEYVSSADILNREGDEGWQLVGVSVIRSKLEHEVGEIFYLMRQGMA